MMHYVHRVVTQTKASDIRAIVAHFKMNLAVTVLEERKVNKVSSSYIIPSMSSFLTSATLSFW